MSENEWKPIRERVVMSLDDLDVISDRIAAASETVSALCRGDARWTMSVPARPTEDPDLVISAALMDARKLLIALEAEREKSAALLTACEAVVEMLSMETPPKPSAIMKVWTLVLPAVHKAGGKIPARMLQSLARIRAARGESEAR